MTPAQLSRTVLRTVRRAVEDGELRVPVPGAVAVKRPPRPGCGDYATGIALQLARPAGLPSLRVAEILRPRLAGEPGIAGVEVAGPGFLNITLGGETTAELVGHVLGEGLRYGHGSALTAEAHRLHIPRETRAAVTADTVGRLLRSQGARARVTCDSDREEAWGPLGLCSDGFDGLDGIEGIDGFREPSHSDEPSVSPCGAGPVPPAHGDEHPATPSAARLPAPPASVSFLRPVPAPGSAEGLLRRLGPDALRWALLRPASHDRPRITDELLVQRESNPLFRVRYAHARARALVRNADGLGVRAEPGDIAHTAATALLAALREYPSVLLAAARQQAPDRVARYLEEAAGAFFRFHDGCPVLPRGDEKPSAAHRARAALADAAGTVLAGGLHLLGIHAPRHL